MIVERQLEGVEGVAVLQEWIEARQEGQRWREGRVLEGRRLEGRRRPHNHTSDSLPPV